MVVRNVLTIGDYAPTLALGLSIVNDADKSLSAWKNL